MFDAIGQNDGWAEEFTSGRFHGKHPDIALMRTLVHPTNGMKVRGLLAEDPAVFHYEGNSLQRGDVVEGVAGDGDYVGGVAGL